MFLFLYKIITSIYSSIPLGLCKKLMEVDYHKIFTVEKGFFKSLILWKLNKMELASSPLHLLGERWKDQGKSYKS